MRDYKIAQNSAFFEKNKIQNVLIVAEGLKKSFEGSKKYLQINIQDREEEFILKEWASCMKFIHESKGNTLVHCLGGVSRSASTVMAYAMFKENLSFQQSEKKITKLHSTANPNSGFLKQLEFWEEILTQYRQVQPLNTNGKEIFPLLYEFVTKFIQTQEKRIAYHIKMTSLSKTNKRDKKNNIQESDETDPVENQIQSAPKIHKPSKNTFLNTQKEFEKQFEMEQQEEEQKEDQYQSNKEQQDQEQVQDQDYEEQNDEFQELTSEQINNQQNGKQNKNKWHQISNNNKQTNPKDEQNEMKNQIGLNKMFENKKEQISID